MEESRLLVKLFSSGRQAERAWRKFLRKYSNLILKVIWQFEKNMDDVMEAYTYVCSKLVENNFAILKKYDFTKPDRPKFSTWLALVVRNLCIDHFRVSEKGKRYANLIKKLSQLERTVFELYYFKAYPVDEIEKYLKEKFGLEKEGLVVEILRDIEEKWGGEVKFVSYDDEIGTAEVRINDWHAWINEAVMDLPELERVVVLLKFWEDMTVSEISEILQIHSKSKVYKILKNALKMLRKKAEQKSGRGGNFLRKNSYNIR